MGAPTRRRQALHEHPGLAGLHRGNVIWTTHEGLSSEPLANPWAVPNPSPRGRPGFTIRRSHRLVASLENGSEERSHRVQ